MVLDVEAVVVLQQHQWQQIFGVQNAFDVVEIVADDRKARMLRLDDGRQQIIQRVTDFEVNELRAGNHDVPRLHVGYLQSAEYDVERFRAHDLTVRGVPQHFHELGAVRRLVAEEIGHPLQECPLRRYPAALAHEPR